MIDDPRPIASEDEKPSANNRFSLWRSKPAFTSRVHITPLEVIATTEEKSYFPGLASINSTKGRANASPTIITVVTRCCSIFCKANSASKLLDTKVTQVPPPAIAERPDKSPVPCINGGNGRLTGPAAAPLTRARCSSRSVQGGTPSLTLPPAPNTFQRAS